MLCRPAAKFQPRARNTYLLSGLRSEPAARCLGNGLNSFRILQSIAVSGLGRTLAQLGLQSEVNSWLYSPSELFTDLITPVFMNDRDEPKTSVSKQERVHPGQGTPRNKLLNFTDRNEADHPRANCQLQVSLGAR